MTAARRGATDEVLSKRRLNRALLDRQLLLERSHRSIVEAVEQVGGLQTQYAPSGYVGLWTRLARFERDELTRALEDRSIVQASLMRTTIHMVSGREFWRFAAGVRTARQEWAAQVRVLPGRSVLEAGSRRLRDALADGPRSVKELDGLAAGFIGNLGLFVELVRVPPSGTWERRRADRLALAEQWVGPEDATEEEGRTHLVRAYLRGFGPARWKDISAWAGVPVAAAKAAGANLELRAYRDEDGRELVDLAGAAVPDQDAPAPVRFLPHWDNNLLVHARRTGLVPEEHRAKMFSTRNPFSVGAVLVDGRVVAAWSVKDGVVVLDAYEPIPKAARDEIEAERAALEAFHA